MEDPQEDPLTVHCFCVCSGSALLGDLLGVSRCKWLAIERPLWWHLHVVRRLSPQSPGGRACLCVFFFHLVCLCCYCVPPGPTQYIFHMPMAQYSLYVLKVLLNTKQTNNHLVGRQEGHPACRKLGVGLLVMPMWLELRMFCSSSYRYHFHNPCSSELRGVETFWYWLTRVAVESICRWCVVVSSVVDCQLSADWSCCLSLVTLAVVMQNCHISEDSQNTL